MITSHTINLDSGRQETKRIYEHIGSLSATSALIDQKLSLLLAWVLGAEDRERTSEVFDILPFNTKMQLLERALPSEWPDKKRFKAAIEAVQSYRNQLAHSIVSWKFSLSTGETSHQTERPKSRQRELVELTELPLWETRATVLDTGLLVLTKFFARSDVIVNADLRNLTTSFFENVDDDHRAAIDYLFPGDRGTFCGQRRALKSQ